MLSIVIPAYNEEKYIALLLESLKSQSFRDFEVIVADSSLDKTREIAEGYGCTIVDGGLPGKARNSGARVAKHDLLFLDADVVIRDKLFLEKLREASRNLDMATCVVDADSSNLSHKIYFFIKNCANILWFVPHVSGQCIYIKRVLFEKIGGYDETLFLGEEHDLAQRAKKAGARIAFLKGIKVYSSPRRIEKEGFFPLLAKSILSECYRMLFGKMRSRIMNYDFGKY